MVKLTLGLPDNPTEVPRATITDAAGQCWILRRDRTLGSEQFEGANRRLFRGNDRRRSSVNPRGPRPGMARLVADSGLSAKAYERGETH
jgi:hypothetical protein